VEKPEEQKIPMGPMAGETKPEVKKPTAKKPATNPVKKKNYTWAQSPAAPLPTKKHPEQR